MTETKREVRRAFMSDAIIRLPSGECGEPTDYCATATVAFEDAEVSDSPAAIRRLTERSTTYQSYGDSPESALAALKEAVKAGEEGWSW